MTHFYNTENKAKEPNRTNRKTQLAQKHFENTDGSSEKVKIIRILEEKRKK
jgi:hypothetical protein